MIDRFPVPDGLQKRWQALPGNARGAIWMIMATACAATMGALFKVIGQRIIVFEIILIRQLIVAAIIIPMNFHIGLSILRTPMLKFHVLRGFFASVAMATGFSAIIYMPLAEAVTISFSQTLFLTILAIPLLGERVGIRRWTVTIIGFIGVLIIVRPTPDGFSIFALLALISAFGRAVIGIILRKVTQIDRPATIMAYQCIFITAVMIGPSIYYWVTPTLTDFLLILLIGLLMWLLQITMIQGYKAGEAVAIAPVEYTRLLFATILGYFLFGEVPTIWTITGASIIIGSTLYTVHRNAIVKRKKAVAVTDKVEE